MENEYAGSIIQPTCYPDGTPCYISSGVISAGKSHLIELHFEFNPFAKSGNYYIQIYELPYVPADGYNKLFMYPKKIKHIQSETELCVISFEEFKTPYSETGWSYAISTKEFEKEISSEVVKATILYTND